MLKDNYAVELTPFDLQIFETLVPADHYLRHLKAAIDFTAWRGLVADCYASRLGRPAIDPVCLLKLSLLQFHYDLSDDAIMRQTQVNVAFRFFLDWPAHARLPEPSLLSQFRSRLGADRFARIFQEVLRQARAAGLVRDRLRLKDATHLVAGIAVPSTLQLVAQTREQLLRAAESFAADKVARHRQTADDIRQSTAELKNEARLLARVRHLRELIDEAADWQAGLAADTPSVTGEIHATFVAALATARKVVGDREPKAKDKLLSLVDPEMRRSRHGDYYAGYLLDLTIDADSELICALDVLPANGDEAVNARALIDSERAAHGNRIEGLSIDGIGFNGPVIKDLSEAPEGPQLTVYVPPKPDWSATPELFQAADFQLNEAGDEVRCPQGETTRTRHRDPRNYAWAYRFKASVCRACPQRAHCLSASTTGPRQVRKNDFQAQYDAAKHRATTDEYKQVRQRHGAVERKLNELVRWHQGRRVRYRRRWRAKVQYLLLGIVVNCKRIVRLLAAATATQPA